jgi:hypothetical protein
VFCVASRLGVGVVSGDQGGRVRFGNISMVALFGRFTIQGEMMSTKQSNIRNFDTSGNNTKIRFQ